MQIYKTTNNINGKIYIGKDVRERDYYLGSGYLLNKAIKKYGKENFRKEILETCSTKEQLEEREKYWIRELQSTNRSIGYNITEGGTGGDTLTNNPNIEIISAKISNKMKNRIFTKQHIENLKKNNWRLKSNAEDIEKKRKISLQKPKSEEHKQKLKEIADNEVEMRRERMKKAFQRPGFKEMMNARRESEIQKIVEMSKDDFTKWMQDKSLYNSLGNRNGRLVNIIKRRGEYDFYYGNILEN